MTGRKWGGRGRILAQQVVDGECHGVGEEKVNWRD